MSQNAIDFECPDRRVFFPQVYNNPILSNGTSTTITYASLLVAGDMCAACSVAWRPASVQERQSLRREHARLEERNQIDTAIKHRKVNIKKA